MSPLLNLPWDHVSPAVRDRCAELRSAALGYAADGRRVMPVWHVKCAFLPDPVYRSCGALPSECRCPKECACWMGRDCPKPGKHPVFPGWPGLATTDPDRIGLWWCPEPYPPLSVLPDLSDRRWPEANIGIATGEGSGIFVLDVDPGAGGLDSLQDLADRGIAMPETYRYATGSGGIHYWFAWPGWNPRNSVGRARGSRLGRGLDIRADGGQVVVPPSRSGYGPYVADGPALPVLPAPAGFLALLRPPELRGPRGPLHARRAGGLSRYGEAALRNELRRVADAVPGERNDVLNRASYSLGRLAGAGLLDEERVAGLLMQAGERAGLGEDESRRTVASGMRRGAENPRETTRCPR